MNYKGSDSISPLSFTYDRVFEDTCSQADVFDDVRSVVRSVLAGRNGTVMAYGTAHHILVDIMGFIQCDELFPGKCM